MFGVPDSKIAAGKHGVVVLFLWKGKKGLPKQLLKLTGLFRDKETLQPQEQ